MTKPAMMAGASRLAHFAGLGARRARSAEDDRDEGAKGRRADEDEDGAGDQDDDERRDAKSKAKSKRGARRADEEDGDDERDPDKDGDDDTGAKRSRNSRAAEDDDDKGDDDRRDAKSKRGARRADDGDDEEAEDDDDEREMNGRNAAAGARRRERARCVAIFEATAEAMGNPALLDSALLVMESSIGRHRAIRRIDRAARNAKSTNQSERRSAGNPRLGSDTPPSGNSAAAAAVGWEKAIASATFATPKR